jgi:predicted nucleotidyltransferase/HEPN domain-containing protein
MCDRTDTMGVGAVVRAYGHVKTLHNVLAEKKRRKLEAIATIIQRQADVEMIILFGSHARGDWVADLETGYFSDFDVLVIVKSRRLAENHNLWYKIEKRVQEIANPTSITVIVHDIKDVNDQLEKGFYFFSDIKKEGVMLYDSGRFKLADEKEHTAAERQMFARQMFDLWFTSAKEFYENFEFSFGRGYLKPTAFLLHQATERLYHAVLLVFIAYKPKTHNIEELGKQCGHLHPSFRDVFPQDTPEDKRLFNLLKHAYVDARYNMKYVITADELTALAARVRELTRRVEQACLEKMEAMTAEA